MESEKEVTVSVLQSPNWDHVMPLSELWKLARFFILRRDSTSLVNLVMDSREINGVTVYDYQSLSHDQHGITYDADGSIQADYIRELIQEGKAELTTEYTDAIRHIWECMNCQPFSAFATTPPA